MLGFDVQLNGCSGVTLHTYLTKSVPTISIYIIYNIYICVIYLSYPSFSHLTSVLLMSLLISVTSGWCPQERPWEWWHRVKWGPSRGCVCKCMQPGEKVEGARIPLMVIKLQYHWDNCDVVGQVTWVLWQTDTRYLVQTHREDNGAWWGWYGDHPSWKLGSWMYGAPLWDGWQSHW